MCGRPHSINRCETVTEYIQAGKCRRNYEGKVVLPSGAFVPQRHSRHIIEESHRRMAPAPFKSAFCSIYGTYSHPAPRLSSSSQFQRKTPSNSHYIQGTVVPQHSRFSSHISSSSSLRLLSGTSAIHVRKTSHSRINVHKRSASQLRLSWHLLYQRPPIPPRAYVARRPHPRDQRAV